MKEKRRERGITLIALVITIVILIILATITVNFVFGENGLINRAQQGTEEYNRSDIRDRVTILQNEFLIDKATGEEDNFANFLRKELQVGVTQNEKGNYNFTVDDWQVEVTENEVISIERLNMNPDKIYTNVASMKADTGLTDGQLVQTESYWDKQYGGSAYYDIVSSASLTVDDTKCIQLDNGLYAELHPINDTVTVNQFGAYGDGEHDDEEAINKALNAGYSNVSFENERYKFGKNIKLSTDNVCVIGNDATLFWDENVITPWEQIGIAGTSEKHVQNITISYLNFENGNISVVEDPGESIQVRGSYCDNVEISNCNFNIYEINGNNSRQVTNLWFQVEWNDIVVENCKFINLTNGNVGGNIWISDLTSNENYMSRNAVIKNNYMEKSCHDETIAVWGGKIDNVIIQNNEFYIHEEEVENRSTMNFTFGNDGILTNLQFIGNIVKSETKDYLMYLNGNEGSENIYIKENDIKYTIISDTQYYQPMFNQNKYTRNVQVDSNKIEYNAENDGVINSFSMGTTSYTNNRIKINATLKNVFGSTDLYDGNKIEINGNVQERILTNNKYFKNNEVILNGRCPQYMIFMNVIELTEEVSIENNKFIINDPEQWTTNSVHFIFIYNSKLNNKDIKITNNIIETPNQINNQNLIQLNSIRDTTIQEVDISDNKNDIFKNIILYNNSVAHKILVKGKEINYSTSLE